MDLQTFSRRSQLAWQQQATSGDFQHYLHMTQALLTEVHGHSKLAELYQPFEWAPEGFWDLPHAKRRGVLLVHGLLDSPSRMGDLAQTYLDQGYLVRTLLLTGHGLKPQALNHVHKEDWFALVQFGIKQLERDTGACLLLGHSGGGALCLWYLLTCESAPIQGIIAFAPPIRLKDPFSIILPLLHRIPHAFMFPTHRGTEVAKYERFSQHFAYQAHMLGHQLRKLMAKRHLPVPAYFILAAHDETIDSNTAKAVLLKEKNPAHRICWYSPKPLLTDDARLLWQTSVYPDFGIRDFSHISLCTRADNPNYGAQAYEQARAKIGKLARPCFNPDYDAMTERLLAFSADNSHT